MMTGPVWMYRNGEARLFASPDEIPADEGWMDSPVTAETPVKRKRQAKAEAEDNGDSAADSDKSAS